MYLYSHLAQEPTARERARTAVEESRFLDDLKRTITTGVVFGMGIAALTGFWIGGMIATANPGELACKKCDERR